MTKVFFFIKTVVLIILLVTGASINNAFSATFVVSSNANAGANTLRQAIIDANASPGADIINFNFVGATTITLTSCQQQITGPVTINGYSNPGAGAGNLMIEVISTVACNVFEFAAGSDGSTIRGIAISGGTVAIYLNNSDGHTVSGNYIGTNLAGTAIAASRPQNGIHAYLSDNTLIGGTGGQIDRNIVSGATQTGIRFESSTNAVIINNYVGTDVTGNIGLGNGEHGIYGYNNSNNPRVGGTTSNERNVVCSNSSHGIFFNTSASPVIKGNVVGMGVNGTAILGNGGSGINCETTGACQIGGLTLAERNYVSNSGSFGIVVRYAPNTVIEGNWIGVDMATGLLDYGNYDAAITVTNSADVRIGGSVSGSGNICSASGNPGGGADGISIWSTSPRPIIKGNIIGLGADGTTALQNYGHGIECVTCDDGVIGGTTALERNVVAASFNIGLQLVNSPRITVWGNYVGTDVTGLLDKGGSQVGIAVSNSANALIGGSVSGTRNIVCGNAESGVLISGSSSGTIVKGNLIGLGSDGLTSIRNDQFGISISGNQANNCVIGGTSILERNIISSNGINTSHHGLFISGGSTGHSVINNFIGTNENGTIAKGNTGHGIYINNCTTITVDDNIVSANGAKGIEIVNASFITVIKNSVGTDVSGTLKFGNGSEGVRFSGAALDNIVGGSVANANIITDNNGTAGVLLESSGQRNTITFNSIYCNAGLGIDLQGTANESVLPPGITSSGANSINGTGVTGNTIHVYRNATGDGGAKCNCEGEIYIGTTTVAGGTWAFTHNLGLTASEALSVTATQTTINGSTSEFTSCSSPLPVDLTFFTVEKNADHTVSISWTTASEKNNDRFAAQRSRDGINFQSIAVITGAGNSSTSLNYHVLDTHPMEGVSYYRLQQIDYDGTNFYSGIKSVIFLTNPLSMSALNNELKVWVKEGNEKEFTCMIYSIKGELVKNEKIQILPDASQSSIKLNLPSAIYMAYVYYEDNFIMQKIFISE